MNEVAATVEGVMSLLRRGVSTGDGKTDGGGSGGGFVKAASNPHVLSWQSKVGFLPWMGPKTSDVIEGLGAQGYKHVLAVPIAFTSDHIETLFEIDIEYGEAAHKAGIVDFRRAPSLNDEPLLTDAMADIVAAHVQAERAAESAAYALNCPGCTNPACRTILNPVAPYEKARESHANCSVANWPTAKDIQALKARGTSPCP